MKALLINTSFYPNIGGVENSFRSISEELSKQGWEVDIVASDNFTLKPIEYMFGAKVTRYKQGKLGLGFINLIKLLKKSDLSSYNIIISRSTVTSLALSLLNCHKYNFIVPGVYKYQNKTNFNIIQKIKYLIHCQFEKAAFKNSKNIFVFSKSMKDQISSIVKNKNIELISPGVDTKRFHKISAEDKKILKRELHIPLEKRIILCIGRFVKIKNFHTILQAMPLVNNDHILILVGSGNELTSYQEFIKINNLDDRVYIFDKTLNPESFYSISDVFCLPSTYEPFGQVLLEASCSGLPIVALDSNIENVDTATKSIYEDFPSLVTYVPKNTPESFADVFNNEPDLDESKSGSYVDFSNRHSWNTLIFKLKFNNLS
ncbi:glycosyltransferase family 4 protein [Providencia sp. Me31A]|uniref:glycosyltransferase family 4 protein n=1 Tax=Providencia sp. Me31A TaxID=3392637 RepID=UPI003D29D2A2